VGSIVSRSILSKKVTYEVQAKLPSASATDWFLWVGGVDTEEDAKARATQAKKAHPGKQFRVVRNIRVAQECLNLW